MPSDSLAIVSDGGADTRLDVYRQSHTVDTPQSPINPRVPASIPLEIQQRICCDPWALRHRFLHAESGLVAHATCGRYSCLFCGPRRVSMWRSTIELASPERFVTLTRVGDTLAEVGRVTTTICQRLRRAGYKFEYCATFERHKRAGNGFHVHMLQRGDYIPKGELSAALLSATHGRSFVVDVHKCKPGSAGYVTKYCTKMLTASEQGSREDGTRARVNRVRYSRQFFPAPVAQLRDYLKAQALDKLEEAGGAIADLDGAWVLQEFAELPRVNGRVDAEAASAQYHELLAVRVDSLDGSARRGDAVVLRFMLDELTA